MMHGGYANPEFGRNIAQKHTLSAKALDFGDLLNRNFAGRSAGRTPARAALRMAVSSVVGMGAEKKMVDVHARRVVAAMANVQPLWDGAMDVHPHNAMCEILFAASLDNAVSIGVSPPWPLNTIVHGSGFSLPLLWVLSERKRASQSAGWGDDGTGDTPRCRGTSGYGRTLTGAPCVARTSGLIRRHNASSQARSARPQEVIPHGCDRKIQSGRR